jgi:hypothetical protein
MDADARMALIKDQLNVLRFWRAYMFVMYGLHYFLGLTAVTLSVSVASKRFSGEPAIVDTLSLILAVVTAWIVFITPERIAERYQRAYQLLSVAITKYLADTSFTVTDVTQAYEAGEAVIHQKRATE